MSPKKALAILAILLITPVAIAGCSAEPSNKDTSSKSTNVDEPIDSDVVLGTVRKMFADVTLTDEQIVAEAEATCKEVEKGKSSGTGGKEFVDEWVAQADTTKGWTKGDGRAVITYATATTCPELKPFVMK